jgi:hypothetical protein
MDICFDHHHTKRADGEFQLQHNKIYFAVVNSGTKSITPFRLIDMKKSGRSTIIDLDVIGDTQYPINTKLLIADVRENIEKGTFCTGISDAKKQLIKYYRRDIDSFKSKAEAYECIINEIEKEI